MIFSSSILDEFELDLEFDLDHTIDVGLLNCLVDFGLYNVLETDEPDDLFIDNGYYID